VAGLVDGCGTAGVCFVVEMKETQPLRFLSVVLLILLTAACTGHKGLAPVDDRAGQTQRSGSAVWHTVRSGDTLFSIAFAHGRDFRAVARLNKIEPPYTIYPGQRIQIRTHEKRRSRSQKKRTPASVVTNKQHDNKARKSPVRAASSVSWVWPVAGKVIRNYKANAPRKKGIGISGRRGQAVTAAASGKVVYSGDGLIGYGKLIIIKHNESYLSAYAHNRRVDVKEGQLVKRGEKISSMGDNENNQPMLHFEIRKNGKPVNPLAYLPRR